MVSVVDRSQVYQLKITQKASSSGCPIRRIERKIEVPFEQLSARLRELGKQGYQIVNVTLLRSQEDE